MTHHDARTLKNGTTAEGEMGGIVKQRGDKPPAMAAPVKVPGGIKLPGGNVLHHTPGKPPTVDGTGEKLGVMGGSEFPHFNEVLLTTTLTTLNPASGLENTHVIAAAAAALAAFKPTDEIEGMIAGQAVALHHAAMECLRRAMLGGQHPEAASKLRKDGANLARAMTDMVEALDRKRGKGPQVVRVERVVVHEGGQAIVGNVQAAGRPKVGEG